MGEPITLYDADGQPVVVYGNAQAAELLATGKLTESKPSQKEAPPAPSPKATGKKSG